MHHVTDDEGADTIRAIAGPDSLLLRGDRLPTAHDHRHTDRFTLREGESVELSLTWSRSWDPVPPRLSIPDRLDQTRIRWGLWARSSAYQGTYRETVVRSLLVLRLLTDQETGGIVAAPTTSLPEDFGGERNWDYRFCWLRDAAMTLEALLEHGYDEEATDWRGWLLRAVAGRSDDLQIMYRVDGGRRLPERSSTTSSGTPAAGRSAWATRPSSRCRTTCSARSCARSSWPATPGSSRPTTPGRCSATSSTICSSTGASRTAASGRSAATPSTSRTRR